MQDLGLKTLQELHQALHEGELKTEIRSSSAQREGAVHDLVRPRALSARIED